MRRAVAGDEGRSARIAVCVSIRTVCSWPGAADSGVATKSAAFQGGPAVLNSARIDIAGDQSRLATEEALARGYCYEYLRG